MMWNNVDANSMCISKLYYNVSYTIYITWLHIMLRVIRADFFSQSSLCTIMLLRLCLCLFLCVNKAENKLLKIATIHTAWEPMQRQHHQQQHEVPLHTGYVVDRQALWWLLLFYQEFSCIRKNYCNLATGRQMNGDGIGTNSGRKK